MVGGLAHKDAAATLGLLLPVTSRLYASPQEFVKAVLCCVWRFLETAGSNVRVVLGVDEQDLSLSLLREELIRSALTQQVATVVLSQKAREEALRRAQRLRRGYAGKTQTSTRQALNNSSRQLEPDCPEAAAHIVPLCHIWDVLARYACAELGCEGFILLGDDVDVQPQGWAASIEEYLAAHPEACFLILKDAADPGFPSFPVVRASHFQHFRHLLPDAFINQDGDPFLCELYRSCGAVRSLMDVTAHNSRGGVQLAGRPYVPPSYARCSVPHAVQRALLRGWREQLCRSLALAPHQRHLTLDILVPSLRGDAASLDRILSTRCSQPHVSLRFLVQLEPGPLPQAAADWLRSKQACMGHQLRVRRNRQRLGAPANRNELLDASFGEYIIFFDDDVVPSEGCIDAYVQAFRLHPQECAFAGPTFLPHGAEVLPSAVHMSDVSFFWEAPANASFPRVPWAISANFAFRNSACRFSSAFPKSGGGEDIDYCLQHGHHLVSVPSAACSHPLWSRHKHVLTHPFNWAQGDGALIALHPAFAYSRAPNAVELCAAAVALACLQLFLRWDWRTAARLTSFGCAVTLLDMLKDTLLKYAWAREQRHRDIWGWRRLVAAAVAAIIVKASQLGRLIGHIRRHERGPCQDFDWFCGMLPGVVRRKQMASLLQLIFCAVAAAFLWNIVRRTP